MRPSPDRVSVTMLWLLSNSEAGGVREDRWLEDEGCGGQRESTRKHRR